MSYQGFVIIDLLYPWAGDYCTSISGGSFGAQPEVAAKDGVKPSPYRAPSEAPTLERRLSVVRQRAVVSA
jgi:hypothetical protein